MEFFDVAIVGGGPAGSSCAAFCALAGLRTLVLEREKFPREKVCGDCLNPSCWVVLNRLDLVGRIRALQYARLARVEFIAIGGRRVIVELPSGDEIELAVKRSLFDDLLLKRAHELGAHIHQETTVTALDNSSGWKIETAGGENFVARVLIGADGRNSTVARLRNLLPRPERERIALQSHLPLPDNFRNRVVLQLLPQGYAGLSPVSDEELNVCLVATPRNINALKAWATKHFDVSPHHAWRTITPLTRAPIPPAHENLFLIGDAARVIEPFTGEGIFYAMRSGELAANAIARIIRGEDREPVMREFTRAYAQMYRGRLWINHLARAAVLSPRIASIMVRFAPLSPSIMRLLTAKIALPPNEKMTNGFAALMAGLLRR
jgi:menaquinone-9 beta-reductase